MAKLCPVCKKQLKKDEHSVLAHVRHKHTEYETYLKCSGKLHLPREYVNVIRKQFNEEANKLIAGGKYENL